ncbi:hypothetical protein DGMP_22910 [Desulfomarina profundi]|uniref:CCHC-type domain-containing protein n=1 Tax=Desulfomarina profundi TaxID=2772557 RepID=A0A8D5FM72_9BACT|nr:hypothetical protein [Desulfomarina profundi]BCL61598.1 hypothetical protein DGMP_22910 [Desulfomarina profundi]
MACSKCGKTGHNARSCPENRSSQKKIINGRDRMIIAIDNTDEESLNKIAALVMEAKRKIDPNARGTIVLGDENSLPHKVLQLLENSGNTDE